MIVDELKKNDDAGTIVVEDADTLHLWSLVLSSVGIDHSIESGELGFVLHVDEKRLEAARHQIYLYEEENRPQASAAERYRDRAVFKPPTLLIMLLFVVFFFQTGPWQGQSAWFVHGAIDRRAIVADGQWWRLVTALTLHADVVHLAGNMVLGGGIIHLLCRMVGTGLGWSLIMLAGTCGNLVNILMHRSQHLSVGFSTAVFGAIGLICGLEMIRRRRLQETVLVLGAGLGLLAMLGTGGQRVDLGAHFWGFLVGGGLGAIVSSLRHFTGRFPGFLWQIFLFFSVVMVVGLAWRRALIFG